MVVHLPGAREAHAAPTSGSGHVILFGVGTVGNEVMSRLAEAGVDVVAIDRGPSERSTQLAQRLGVRLIRGDVTAADVFAALDVRGARSFIACTSDDKTNLEVALIIHDARPDLRTVVRLNNDNLGRQLEARFPSWTVLGLPSVAAPSFVAAALAPDVHRSWRVEDQVMAVAEIMTDEPRLVREVPDIVPLYIRRENGEVEHWPAPPTPLVRGDRLGGVVGADRLHALGGLPTDGLAEMRAKGGWRARLRAVGVKIADADGRLLTALGTFLALFVVSTWVFVEYKGLEPVASMYYTITTMATVGYGDINLLEDTEPLKIYGSILMLMSVFTTAVITAFLTNWVLADRLSRLFGRHRTLATDHIIVVGLGGVGYKVLDELRRIVPATTAIDLARGESLAAEALQGGAAVITGDARQVTAFERSNVDEARSVVVATSDDLVNLEIALTAREANPRIRIVVRLFDEEFAAHVRGTFDIDAVLSPAALAAPSFAAAALGRSVADRFTVEGEEYLFIRMHVEDGSRWVGATVADLVRGRDTAVLAYQPAIGRPRLRPSPRTPLRAGDVVTLICSEEAWAELEREEPASLGVA